MNRNTRARLIALRKERKRTGAKASGYKAKRFPFQQNVKRPELAGTYGYDSSGKYVGKPWGQCW